ncbi:helix-turn-helix domain-containing protein, partial [Listeria monocytogenes]|nr:helix-turn-helix domain-containing protein [Listeria monocytogenes]
QKRVIYQRVIDMLSKGESISKIAEESGITRQTVYRIKNSN